jgi:hypothetical protein
VSGSWSASVRVDEEGLELHFVPPVRRVRMSPETARQFAAHLLLAAERAELGDTDPGDDPQRMTVER